MDDWSLLSLFGVQFCSYTFFWKATSLQSPIRFTRAEVERHLILVVFFFFFLSDRYLTAELMTQLPPLSALDTILVSKYKCYNWVSVAEKNLFYVSKVRIKSLAVNCRSINTFWQSNFRCLVYLQSQQLWRLLFLMAISPSPFGLLEIHPCAKSTCISWSPNLCPVVII